MHRRLLALTRESRLALLLTVVSGFLAGLLSIWQAWLLSNTIHNVFIKEQMLDQVWNLLRLLLLVIAGRSLLTWLNEIWANHLAVRVKTDLRERLFAHIQALGPAFTRAERTGELTTAAVEGIEALDAYFSQYLPQLVITALVPLSILFFAFPIDLLSGVVMLVTAPLIPFFMILIGKGAEIVTKRQYESLSRLSAHFLDSLQGLTSLKIFGQAKAQVKNIEKSSEQFRDATMQVLRITFLSALALELLTTISTAVIAVEIGLRLLYAKMGFLQALFILILAPEFYLPLRMLGLRFHAGMNGTAAARRIYEILDMKIGEQQVARREKTGSQISSIKISHLSFTYPNDSTPALQDINLQIQAGQHVALVGHSGAGKSTLTNLLLGFVQPSSGNINAQFVGSGIHRPAQPATHQPALIEYIAWVPQKPYLFHDTIAANIRLGKPDASEEEVISAAQAAFLHDFIVSLPEGYQTVIGEGGARLSGGQAQRLALARAFLKNAPILILDEPTSSLDPETETLLEESTRQLMQGKTVITIAHRLNTIFQADLIVVLEKGRLIEQGKHRELIALEGVYARMVNALQGDHRKLKFIPPQRTKEAPNVPSIFIPPPVPQDQAADKSNKKNTLARLLTFLNGSWEQVGLSVLLGTLTIGANVSLMGVSAWLISTAALHPSIAELNLAIVGVRFFGISRAVFRYAERLVSHNVTFQLLSRLRVWFYQRLEPLAPARLMDYRAGDLLARIIGDVETLENFYVRVVAPPLVALATGIGVAVFLASFYPALAFLTAVFFISLGFLLPFSSLLLGRKPGQALIALRSDLNVRLVDGIQGLADILAYGQSDEYARQIAITSREYGLAQKRMARISGFHSGLATLLTNLGLWSVVYLSIPQVTKGLIPGPMLASLALLTLASFEAVTPLPIAAQMWESVRVAAGRLFDIVDTRRIAKTHSEQVGKIGLGKRASFALEFSNLSFSYPRQNLPAIRDVSFGLEPGKSLAIVGPSGAGKSTLVSLLLRFWEPSSGNIFLFGKAMQNIDEDEVRAKHAVITQSSYLFNTSIFENLRLARPSASKAEIEKAAKQAQIHEFILSLPEGYQTYIGEQGQRLSGGERQRLAIARALLRDAPILILDEPTANLDPLTERQVLETLFQVMQRKTTIWITHRLIGLENADHILVIENGRIVERGAQTELLAQDGAFRRLWELQNRILEG